MADISDIDEVYFFKFSIDDDCRDGTYSEPRKIRAQNKPAATLKKIWAVFWQGGGTSQSSPHGRASNMNGQKKLSIKRPGKINDKPGKKLLIFAIAQDGHFDKGVDPIVFQGRTDAFSKPFFLVEDDKTLKIVEPTASGTIHNNAWAAVVYDDQDFAEGHCYRFAFNLEITKPCPGNGKVVFPVAPDDPWPGPPHNTVDP